MRDLGYHDRRVAERMKDPEFRAAYEDALKALLLVDGWPKSDTHIDAILTRLDAGPLAGPEQIAEFTAKVVEDG